MEGGFWRNSDELRLTSIWAIHDPEGLYELGTADLNKKSEINTTQDIVQFEVRNAVERYKKKCQRNPDNAVIQGMFPLGINTINT